jgi:hypothetical protein
VGPPVELRVAAEVEQATGVQLMEPSKKRYVAADDSKRPMSKC